MVEYVREKSGPSWLAEYAQTSPDEVWLQEVGGRNLTFGAAYHSMLRYAQAFHTLGVAPGDNVVTMIPNTIEATMIWLGLTSLHAVDTGCNHDYRGRMLEYLITNSRARVMVAAARFLPQLAELTGPVGALETIIVPDADDGFPAIPWANVIGHAAFLAGQEPKLDLDLPQPWDISCIVYTSGTTGPSKGVMVSWAQIHAQADGLFNGVEFGEGEGFYNIFPPFHGSNRFMTILSFWARGRLVIRERFSGKDFWNDIRTYGCTTTALLGTTAPFLYKQEPQPDDADNPLDRVIMFPVIPEFRDFRRRFGVHLRTCFSMTEISVPIISGWDDIEDPRSCGRLRDGYPGTEVRVVDAHDYEVPPGTVGELLVRTSVPWTMNQGYFGMPEKTAEAWRNGWFHTGDGFKRDEHGNFYFVDRIKDALRRRGENISSFEVESFINEHPAVLECAVIAVPSELGEDEVKAVIVLKDGQTVQPSELIAFLTPRMPRFMVPRYIEFVGELPKTQATARVQKVELRKNALNALTWDRENPN